MYLNPVKSLKNSFLNFVRYFYNENFTYIDRLIENWVKKIIPFILTIFFTGFIWWLVLLSIVSLTPLSWPTLGPGAWHILNIFQLGLIVWIIEDRYKFIRGGYKK